MHGAAHPDAAHPENLKDKYIGLAGKYEKVTKEANDSELAAKLWNYLERDVSSKLPLPQLP